MQKVVAERGAAHGCEWVEEPLPTLMLREEREPGGVGERERGTADQVADEAEQGKEAWAEGARQLPQVV